jgi:hypothetical protein
MKNQLFDTLPDYLKDEIKDEYTTKKKIFRNLKKTNMDRYKWINDDDFIDDLILVSIFFRRVILPINNTVGFFKIVTKPKIEISYSENKLETHPEVDKIICGSLELDNQTIYDLQQIVEDFQKTIKILDCSFDSFSYETIEEFLNTIQRSVRGKNNA